MTLLDISNLNISFPCKTGEVRVSNGLSLTIERGKSLCIIGESGCGKTMVALGIMRLLPKYAEIKGEIYFKEKNLLALKEKEMRKIRGREISMIFEQPATCLNPVFTVGNQIAEAVRTYKKCSMGKAKQRAIELMDMVGISSSRTRYVQYPHEFSGGMQQRVMIATALAFKPALLIADEPTASLDVTIQVQIMNLLKDLTAKSGTSLLLITHDPGLALGVCDSAIVMYAGEIMEAGSTEKLFGHPKHPYTRALLGAISDKELKPIKGQVPELSRMPAGCRFHPRCPAAEDICRQVRPQIKNGVRCHFSDK